MVGTGIMVIVTLWGEKQWLGLMLKMSVTAKELSLRVFWTKMNAILWTPSRKYSSSLWTCWSQKYVDNIISIDLNMVKKIVFDNCFQLWFHFVYRLYHWGTEAWIQTHLLGCKAVLGLYILSREPLERMYSPSIAMYPSKCFCIHASVPQWTIRSIIRSTTASYRETWYVDPRLL